MATYFHGGSEIQATADGLQTLYLMNPNYVPYSETQHQHQHPTATNMFFLNPAGNALNPGNLSHAPPPNQPFVGIPLSTTLGSNNSDDPNRSLFHSSQEIPALHGFTAPRVQYNLWGPMDHTASVTPPSSSGGGIDVGSQMGFRQQGLSLSLSSQHTVYSSLSAGENDVQAGGHAQVLRISPTSVNDLRVSGNSPSSVSAVSNGISGVQSVTLGSKFLKAAQELLDEVVNVGKGLKAGDSVEGTIEKMKMNKEATAVIGDGPSETSAKQGAELTTAQRQELQMKKAKLVNMLDEVEQRYRQYHHQMQIVVSSFEHAAGLGSARSYTALALRTISKQFRCLKDAISSQIKATTKNLGEDDCLGAKAEGSRLRYVDQQLRQQRALQHMGMNIQHNAWRPQRGLPERAVSVLRAWLFDHFLHPYPKDADKILLAKQTGLTRSQVSNWFINARVRLWKPMVEDMYSEEVKEQEQSGSQDNTNRSDQSNKEPTGSTTTTPRESGSIGFDQFKALESKPEKFSNQNASPTEISNSSMSTSSMGRSIQAQATAGFNLVGFSDVQRSPKKPRSSEMHNSPSNILSIDMDMKPVETSERETNDGYSLISGTTSGGGFGTYQVGNIGMFNPDQLAPRFHGNGVSLTLGLTHCENLSLSGTQQSYMSHPNIQLGRRLEIGTGETDFCAINAPQPSHSSTGYENIDIKNRKRFAAQLLPDFVA